MPAPTPDALRECVIRMFALGEELDTVMLLTGLSENTVRTIRRQWEETGSYRRPETL
ncbi:hypothetical protein FRC12_016184, partial [Ceratobasidium sp. 428]